MLANSDMHHSEQIESWKTVSEGVPSIEKIKTDIRRQNIDFKYFTPQTHSDASQDFIQAT